MKAIPIEILTIGDEILYGQIVDTNSQWISEEADRAGLRIIRKTAVGDSEDAIMGALAEAEQRASVVLITGGLGPTSDDITKQCLAKYFQCKQELNERALAELNDLLRMRGRPMNDSLRQQAMLPACCKMISNSLGTAAGMWFEKKEKVFVSMPGVPHEMKKMMREHIIPMLRDKYQPGVTCHVFAHTVGITESSLAEMIKPWEDALPEHVRLAYLPSFGQIRLRLTASGNDRNTLEKELGTLIEKLRDYAGRFIYGTGDDRLEAVIGRTLAARGMTLAAAESCSGGYLSHLITTVPGSSAWFKGTVIAYANEIKENLLSVSHETLEVHGAVSEQTAVEMAHGARERLGTDVGVAITGIAGPDGGTGEKPVGLIWIACASKKQTATKKLQLVHDRLFNIRMSSVMTLDLIRRQLNDL